MLLLTLLRMVLAFFATSAHCWFMFSLLSARSPGTLLQSCAQDSQYPACLFAKGYSLLHFVQLLLSPFLRAALLNGSLIFKAINWSPQFCVTCKLYRKVFCNILQVKMLNRTGPSVGSCSTPLVISLQVEYDRLITTLQAQPSSQTFSNLIVHPPQP